MQQLNPSEISEIIKQRIEQLDVSSEAQNEGTIVSVADGIVLIHGCGKAPENQIQINFLIGRKIDYLRFNLNNCTELFLEIKLR